MIKFIFIVCIFCFVSIEDIHAQTFLNSFFTDTTWTYTKADTIQLEKDSYQVIFYDDSSQVGSDFTSNGHLLTKQRFFKSGFCYSLSYNEKGLPKNFAMGDKGGENNTHIEFHKNGKIKRIQHIIYDAKRNRSLHGPCFDFDENGTIIKTTIYEYGRIIFKESN